MCSILGCNNSWTVSHLVSSLLRESLGLFGVELALLDSGAVVDSLESPVLEVDV